MLKFKFVGIFITLFFVLLLTGVVSKVEASEGLVELENTQDRSSRCFAASVLMQDFKYKVLLSCRELVYPTPAGSDIFHYVLWAQEVENEKIFKLGTVGVRGEFSSQKAFSKLFVTQEKNPGVRNPSETTIMVGSVKLIELLETPARVSSQVLDESSGVDEDEGQTQKELVPTPKPVQTSRVSGFSALRLLGGILLGIIVFVVIVGLISTGRRRPIE
ncbi:hypothetical protein ACFL2V_20395 [Pseudomonadota bacterium]